VSHPSASLFSTEQPLAARMRPRTLEEYIGQTHILGPGRLLRRAIAADQLSSIILYGPPGTGKTTLARVIAGTTQAHFASLNAVLGGVKDIREAVAEAQQQQRLGRRTILFVDEVHRFNKAQQDALLPWVENGTVILIGATTENPYFEVNKALMSRSRVFQLKPLEAAELAQVAEQALHDRERGYGNLTVELAPDALAHLIEVASGDARSLLNALELAVTTTLPDAHGVVRVSRAVAEESIQQRAVLYDKEGDAHFDTISAFIKSVRGSDPDAALYWLAKMVYAGEDPRFIFRRLLILASEDVGLADPQALGVVTAAAQAFDYVGLPEGRYHLAHATLYLATTAKSNTNLGFFDALEAVGREREGEVPNHLRDGNRDAEGFGHGAGYAYPHAYREHWVAQQYLPDALQARVFYQPSEQGYEAGIRERVARRREAQLAAMLEGNHENPLEILTFTPGERERDRWLARTISERGERLGRVRDALFEQARLQRHHLLLDLNAGSGLLTLESLRRAPEGQVWALANDPADAASLVQQTERLEALRRPVIINGDLSALAREHAERDPELRFDAILGRSALGTFADPAAALAQLGELLAPAGVLLLAEVDAAAAQRLAALIDWGEEGELAARVASAEEALYAAHTPWDEARWREVARTGGLTLAGWQPLTIESEVQLTAAQLSRWFGTRDAPGGYARALAGELSASELNRVEARYRQQLLARSSRWRSVWSVARLQRQPG
jgi:putative ATPase